jgi:hypothetical protein
MRVPAKSHTFRRRTNWEGQANVATADVMQEDGEAGAVAGVTQRKKGKKKARNNTPTAWYLAVRPEGEQARYGSRLASSPWPGVTISIRGCKSWLGATNPT